MAISDERIEHALSWARARLSACERTARVSRSKESRDWAYGEAVALRAMIGILEGKVSA